jgi:uncharacterized protein
MIPRRAAATLERLRLGFPVLAITGPRQSGKTTLARSLFAGKPYVSLENPEEREFAEQDPRRFLARFPAGAVLDEVQRVPALLSWLQGVVDERQSMGEFVLTGSAQLDLMAGVSQSLAGRVGRVELLPLSAAELAGAHTGDEGAELLPLQLDDLLLKGGYPALYSRALQPADWFSNYMATYIERDVRQLLAVRELSLFQRFVRLCAARSGQLLNLASLASDGGIAASTAREWLSVLEASYLVTRLQPHHRNFGKRLVKTPKLYFLDVGLMAWLLSIRDTTMLQTHPARGALFETWAVSEWIKHRFNEGRPADLYFWRDHVGHEMDGLVETPEGLQAFEFKSGATFAFDWIAPALRWQMLAGGDAMPPRIIFGGTGSHERQGCQVQGWREFALGL